MANHSKVINWRNLLPAVAESEMTPVVKAPPVLPDADPAETDADQYPWRARLATTYIIASTNRTGSYLLCEGLSSTDVAGHPTESLTPEYRRDLCQSLYGAGALDMDFSVSLKALVRHSMTSNGVFGTKVHWDQVVELWYESGYDGPPYIFLLDEFPGARYIHLSRRDKLAQAISLSIARQTNDWWRSSDTEGDFPTTQVELVFDAVEILRIEADLVRQDEDWRQFFLAAGISPLEVEYETLVADYRGEIGRVLGFLGLDPVIAQAVPDPRLQRQSTALNEQWHRKIRPNPS